MNESKASRPDVTRGALESSPVATEDVLRALGFHADPDVLSDEPPGLSFDFGNFKLEASRLMNRWLRPVVTLGGVMTTDRTVSVVHFEMPLEVESFEQGLALVTYCVDNHAGCAFKPSSPVSWLSEGRQYHHLLPWEKQSAEYAARPHCNVQRDWARMALRDLANILASVNEAARVLFQFDGEVLTIRCERSVVAMPADGERWSTGYSLKASSLRGLPKRLKRMELEISVWDGRLQIGNRRYSGVEVVRYYESFSKNR